MPIREYDIPECTLIHSYGEDGWRPLANGDHEHYAIKLPHTRATPRFFFVDKRQKGGITGPLFQYWYIHKETTSTDRIVGSIRNYLTVRAPHLRFGWMVFEAQNRTQVATFLRERGEPTELGFTIAPHPLVEEREMPATGRQEFLLRRIEQMQAELEKIEDMPSEPEGMDDGANAILWDARFPGGTRTYSYAARKADDGLWYTTGPRSPKGYSWSDLINWIYENSEDEPTLWTVSEWSILN